MQTINIIKVKSARANYIRAGIKFSGKGREFPADAAALENWPANLGAAQLLTDAELKAFDTDPVITVRKGTLDVAETDAEKAKAAAVESGQDVFDTLVATLERKGDAPFDDAWGKEAAAKLRAGFKAEGVKATKVSVEIKNEDTAEASAKIGGQVLTSLVDFAGAAETAPPAGGSAD